jgi:anti-sigma factor ChrR (cupin superfamily)
MMSIHIKNTYFTACLALAGLFLTSPVLAEENINRSVDDYVWGELMPGVSSTQIWGTATSGDNAYMVRISAGTVIPRHSHTGDYHGILVQGNWVHSNAEGEDYSLMPGSYVLQKGVENHGDRCAGEVDCLVFVHRHGNNDFIPE